MKRFPISEVIKQFAAVFKANGHSLYIVGGAVRDYLLGIENSDFDFTTDALPQEIINMFHAVIPTGIKHGTVTVLFKGNSFEVTTFRTETAYKDHRHPDEVNFVKDLYEDLSRRDFTVNAFAASCFDGKIIDLFNGKRDLKKKIIRAIGEPKQRFSEDALRLLRMCRFCSKLNFTPEKKTFQSACELSKTINYVSCERVFDEISKILSSSKPSIGIKLMEDCNLLSEILPEVADGRNIVQNKANANDVLEHVLIAVDAAAYYKYDNLVRLALLLHDCGKNTKTQTKTPDGAVRFYGHDSEGSKLARKILKGFNCSNEIIERVSVLIANHMVKYDSTWTDGAVKRFINRVGKDNIDKLFELQWCDQIASEGKSKQSEYDEFIERIKKAETEPLSIKDLEISGDDLFENGIPKSKVMGEILNSLLEIVLDNPSLNKKELLIKQALELYRSRINC